MKRSQIFGAIFIAIIAAGVTALIVIPATDSAKSTSSQLNKKVGKCTTTTANVKAIAELYNEAVVTREVPEPTQKSINTLVGMCEYEGLLKAYELGIRVLRNQTGCDPNCVITMEYSPNRLNYVVKNDAISIATLG